MQLAPRERNLRKKLLRVIPEATPGLQVRAFLRGRKIVDLDVGKTARYYDWASLTKVIFTTTALMREVDRGVLDLNLPLKDYLGWVTAKPMVARFFSHSAGCVWWKPFFRQLSKCSTREEAWLLLQSLLSEEKLGKTQKAVYSDLDILYLGFLLERLTERPLLSVAKDMWDELGMGETHFSVDNRSPYPKSRYAPTHRCSWRKKLLRGEVDDENAWSMGGVAPHAGLFGPMDDLETWALGLRRAAQGGSWIVRPTTVQKFLRRAIPKQNGDWALGFTMPSRPRSTSGKHFSSRSVGHTGFTGTSFWWDPEHDLLVLILANRGNPHRYNDKFKEVRPLIHDWIYEIFVGHA